MREVAGSIPARPPYFFFLHSIFAPKSHRITLIPRVYSSAVEHRIADPAVAGSIPAAPYLFFFHSFLPHTPDRNYPNPSHTQCTSLWPNWTRRLTTNQKIGGSSPSRDIFYFYHRWAQTRGLPDSSIHGGALAQSVECALCKREVQGSKP